MSGPLGDLGCVHAGSSKTEFERPYRWPGKGAAEVATQGIDRGPAGWKGAGPPLGWRWSLQPVDWRRSLQPVQRRRGLQPFHWRQSLQAFRSSRGSSRCPTPGEPPDVLATPGPNSELGWSGRCDSNPRLVAPKATPLPTEVLPGRAQSTRQPGPLARPSRVRCPGRVIANPPPAGVSRIGLLSWGFDSRVPRAIARARISPSPLGPHWPNERVP